MIGLNLIKLFREYMDLSLPLSLSLCIEEELRNCGNLREFQGKIKMFKVCYNASPQLVYCIIIYIMFPSFNFMFRLCSLVPSPSPFPRHHLKSLNLQIMKTLKRNKTRHKIVLLHCSTEPNLERKKNL